MEFQGILLSPCQTNLHHLQPPILWNTLETNKHSSGETKNCISTKRNSHNLMHNPWIIIPSLQSRDNMGTTIKILEYDYKTWGKCVRNMSNVKTSIENWAQTLSILLRLLLLHINLLLRMNIQLIIPTMSEKLLFYQKSAKNNWISPCFVDSFLILVQNVAAELALSVQKVYSYVIPARFHRSIPHTCPSTFSRHLQHAS